MIRHIEIHHRSETGATVARHYVNNVIDRSERSVRTMAEAMQYTLDVKRSVREDVMFFIDGVEFDVKAAV